MTIEKKMSECYYTCLHKQKMLQDQHLNFES
jgi:hypothetical protein